MLAAQRRQPARSALRDGSFLREAGPILPGLDRPAAPDLMARLLADGPTDLQDALAELLPARRRKRLGELDRSLHCSVVGTCLNGGEIRRLVGKFTDLAVETADEHALHEAAVMLAGRSDEPMKALTRLLDRKYAATIARLGGLTGAARLLDAWAEHRSRGELAGAYWAILTHPDAGRDVVRRVFGDIHMLSHLQGAAGRADLVRLDQAERDKAELELKLARRTAQAQADRARADRRIRELEAELARAQRPCPAAEPAWELRHRLAEAEATIGRLERRVATLTGRLHELGTRADRQPVQPEPADEPTLATEPAEDRLGPCLAAAAGRTILVVGGRTAHWPVLRAAIEGAGGCALRHDGGIEDGIAELPGAVARADLVLAAIDSVSHGAMRVSKRLAQRRGKPWRALRRASLPQLGHAMGALVSPDALGQSMATITSDALMTA